MDFKGADDIDVGSKLSCLLIADDEHDEEPVVDDDDVEKFFDLIFVASGKGAGLNGCGGMDSSVAHGGVGTAVDTSSPSYAPLSIDSKRLKLPVLPSKISEPE